MSAVMNQVALVWVYRNIVLSADAPQRGEFRA